MEMMVTISYDTRILVAKGLDFAIVTELLVIMSVTDQCSKQTADMPQMGVDGRLTTSKCFSHASQKL